MAVERMNEELKKEIWRTFELLRGNISSDQYHAVLFLLSLQNEGLLEELRAIEPYSRRSKLDELIEGTLIAHNEIFEELYDRIYKPIIDNIQLDIFSRIIDGIFSINELAKEKSFGIVFEEILSFIMGVAGKAGPFFTTPSPLCEFATSLVDIPQHASIYNPFAGLGSFGISVGDTQIYYGQELNVAIWAIGVLRLFAHASPAIKSLLNEDSFHQWYPVFEGTFGIVERLVPTGAERKKVDLIVSNPPFGYKLSEAEYLFGKRYNAETLVLDQGLDILAEGGKIVCIVSNGVLFRGGEDRNVRKRLIDNDYLEMVISFPGAMLPGTSIPFCIIVVNKDKKEKGFVKFVEAQSFITRDKKSWTFNHQDLLEIIRQGVDSDYLKIISNQQIEHSEYNLSVNRYFVERNPEGVKIRELGEIIATSTVFENTGHLITGNWLKSEPLDYLIPNNFVAYAQLPKACRQLTESCFLISTIGGKLKLAYFKYEGIPFYITQEIFTFRLISNLVSPDYFALQVLSGGTQKQVRAYSSGSVMPRLSKADFLSLSIDIPDLESVQGSLQHQEFIVRGTRDAYVQIREKELEKDRQLLGIKDDTTRNFQSMKHTFRQYLSSLKSNTLGTKKFIELNQGKSITMDMIYSKNLGQDLGTHLSNVNALIESLSNLLEDAPEKAEAEIMNVASFVEQFQREFTFDNKFSYTFWVDKDSFEASDGNKIHPTILINRAQFEKVLSNIVTNAVEHGFVGGNDYEIRFEVRAEDKSLILEIKNNGKPITEGFGLKELTTRGEKTVDSKGTGLGGYDIKTIVEAYDGLFNLETDYDDIYPVTYTLKFPIIDK